MKFWLSILFFIFLPFPIFSQFKDDTAAIHHLYNNDSVFSFMLESGASFYRAKDVRINNFLNKYGYIPPRNLPVAIWVEAAVLPSKSKMIYGINAKTIISRQDLITADFSLSVYRRFYQTKNFWFLAGIAIGEHFDRIVLNKNLPPLFDSLAEQYRRTLSLHRIGFITEPTVKTFWYPLQTKKIQTGIFAAVGYALDFNSRWRLGYYPQNSNRFIRLKKPTGINTKHEFGWVFSGGVSIGF
jgi:hypothetical protein